ncbi:mesothelin isoform X1 [Lemur catta]|uniref:mesothelin isoform X1 n=1 Tax=Lemur catta TaxID=9447 RepID=UPI001E268656|nr:mesothelin isoform X1 [Lemur catta]
MASLATRPPGGARGTAPLGSLLLLLLSPGWGQPWPDQAGETGQEAALPDPVLANASSFASLPPGLLLGFSCAEVSGLSTERVRELALAVGRKNVTLRVDQLRCLARGLSAHRVPEDLDAFPPDLLLFLDPAGLSGPQACARFFSRVSAASVDLLPRAAPERQRLLAAALACRGVRGSRVSAADVRALGGLACDLPGRFVADSPAALLPRLAGCPGPLDQDQQEAARAALQGGGPPYGSPSTWTVSTLDTLQGLLPVLGPDTIRSIPKGVMTSWLQRTYGSPSWQRLELTLVLPRFRRDAENMTCPPGREARVVDENLVLYQDWELEACVDGALLAAQMDRVNANPFTYQQLDIFKRKLDKVYPHGYPESLVQRLGCFFLRMSPQDVRKWNVTSLRTVHALLRVSRGRRVDAQVAALIARYVSGGGQLHRDTLDALAGFRPAYLCSFSPEQLGAVPPSILWAVEPQDLDTCSPRQLGVLYPKARLAFRNVSGAVYLLKIQSFLGGASTEDLRVLSQRNVSMDVATFRKLPKEAVVGLTVLEVQRLLGPHVGGLTAEQRRSPVWDWILRQRQDDLDAMGLGLQGGVPNGYLVLDLGGRRRQAEADGPEPRSLPGALSGGRRLLGPGPVLSATLTLPLALGRH